MDGAMPLDTPRRTPPVCVGVPAKADGPAPLSEYMCTQSVRSVKSHGIAEDRGGEISAGLARHARVRQS